MRTFLIPVRHLISLQWLNQRRRAGENEQEDKKCIQHFGIETSGAEPTQEIYDFFFFLVAPTRGSVLPLRSIGLSFLSFLIKDSR
jgi:hypothetical protein